MSLRRFMHLIAHRTVGVRPVYDLHRIDPWLCFFPTAEEAAAAEAEVAHVADSRRLLRRMWDAPLPSASISFNQPWELRPSGESCSLLNFMSLGRNRNNIISTSDGNGSTMLYDADYGTIGDMPRPHKPKKSPVSVPVGDDLYVLNGDAGNLDEHILEALVHQPKTHIRWQWRSLPTPPFMKNPDYNISSHAVVGDGGGSPQIWVSTLNGGGTFSLDVVGGAWSMAGEWALPLFGRVEHAPELGLWFGFTSDGEDAQLAACDLASVSATTPPVLQATWDELEQPLSRWWVPMGSLVLPLGGAKLCVARMFDLAAEDWLMQRERGRVDDRAVETFVLVTGVEVERSEEALRMIRHRTLHYSLGPRTVAHLL